MSASLSALFRLHARPGSPFLEGPEPALEAALIAAVTGGAEAWPTLTLDPGDFVAHLAARLEAPTPGGELADPDRVTDLYLACACAKGLAGALAIFERRHLARAPGYLYTFGDSRAFVDDILQDVRERLFVGSAEKPPRICEYAGRGSLDAFVRIMATRLALDRQERQKWERPMANPPDDLEAMADPELRAMKEEHRESYDQALREVLATLTPDERRLLRLYLLDRLNIAEIGALLRRSRATVARRIAQCRERLLTETRRLLSERLALTPAEMDSLCRLLASGLDISLHGFLAPGAEPRR